MRVRRGAAAFTGRTDERTGGLESALSSCAVLARLDRRLLYAMRTRFHRKWTERVAKVLARALQGRLLDAADYAAYAAVYAYAVSAVNDPEAFAPEHAWQCDALRAALPAAA